MDEIRSKSREIEKLKKLVRECSQTNRKLRLREDETVSKMNPCKILNDTNASIVTRVRYV